ncbi:MAG: FAD-dependent monooxygenase [Mariprofundaceae bacterium]|nr:FAD-dependent monooxygenase [Mariprofundaceae bacterium]
MTVENIEHSTKYDMAIVGGGLAGAALALSICRLGLKVAIIEAHAVDAFTPTQPERVIALSHGSRCHLESLGAWDAIEAAGLAPICKVHVCEPGNRGEVGMHCSEGRMEALGYVVQNAHVLGGLYSVMPDAVDVLAPAQLESLQQDDDGVQLRIVQDGERRQISARLLVGADGTMSRVRSLCNIGSRGWDHNRFGLVASVRPKTAHRDVAHECFRPDGPLAFLPLDDERYSLVWTLAPRAASRIMEMDDEAFIRELESAAGPEMQAHLGGIEEVGPRALFPFEYRVAEHFSAARMALVGNAAHTMHPVAGQGLNLGLRDVGDLTAAVRRAVEDGRDIGQAVVLEEYAQKRCKDTLAVTGFTEGLNTLFCTGLLPVKLARGLGMGGMDRLPALRSWLLKRASGVAQMPDQLSPQEPLQSSTHSVGGVA